MTDGRIWQVMLKLKVFMPWQVLKELNPPDFCKQYAKEKIKSLIKMQLKVRNLVILYQTQTLRVYGFPGESIEKVMRECENCKKKFIPTRDNHRFCSPECRKKMRRKMRRAEGMEERRRYEPWEEEIIWETLSQHGCKAEILQELGKRLNRHPEAIKSKFKKMKTKSRR